MVVNATIYSATGAIVEYVSDISGTTQIGVQGWQQGIYFVQIQSVEKIAVVKLVVE